MRLVKVENMFRRLTYKEFSIALGVVVALIILMAIWLNPINAQSLNTGNSSLPKITLPAARVIINMLLPANH